ncbi:MAG: anhydro-N-acetylmuramic acid kinase [Polynucleobacter sp. 24-46-87]|jgi:anhydro-N-acetylmuramic acid kinase|uniref:anhydro-N-acetylmuramic acid kinase n=1 Tax=unclassified Polynucleobacter TaxID=2640945 RepID=UPI000BD32D04|nr:MULTISPECIES: anhydro-N-acetylmuramic acid kinase [unclassified Polynucleobacter]OYY20878.1 MAG: anhydro-N-acetylmuramic acid kinase [Polynucleobacter sp. 35-46-11]OZA15893.1 MAG: anhydro-N-acetylmuramic acid kinase [Polynucleobacter sp. 24-46-87]OZA78119.1 MAG: anhydro-N-acetylmuramic acid kinase [Polynucleobacter sp. 39-46-10]
MNKPQSLYIGLMSGTSLDGIDAVLAKIEASGESSLLDAVSLPFSSELRKALLDLQTPGPNEIHRENQAANALAVAYADAVKQLLTRAKLSAADISAIGAHGQTIRHQADLAHHLAYTHQTLNPALLAELTGIDVIADFRSRDLAAGGHGAPLVPAFHAQQFATDKNIAVLNLGGIANLTLLSKDGGVKGFDCGPGNMLMDAWIADQQGHAFDENGTWASQGKVNQILLSRMLADPFFAKAPPKSTGRDDFHLEWLQKQIDTDNINAEDIQATLLQLTVDSALQALECYAPQTQTLVICGGGARNIALMDLFKARTEILFTNSLEIVTSDALGIDPQLVEGLAFAWLAWAHKEKRPANLPAVTGAKGPRILGACYPA